MNLKSILKTLKLNESSLSMILGFIVVAIAGILIFNYFRKPSQEVPPTSTPATNQTEQQNGLSTSRTYIVKKGDNLWKISETFLNSGFNWIDIAKENKLTNANLIFDGQELKIPEVRANTPETKMEFKENKEAIEGSSYTVEKGDTLWDIAVRSYKGDGSQWVKIARENKLVNPALIHRGNNLVLPR